ncbi:MAG: hypothetical protein C4532_19105 [Candidatus Abyssobacteria bacterium SURF_17]|uniref:Uncharacterized protein n=1 Tax=Candidatus Abyssobacteria bacterium SURF_17 TaxID=2093361 RepID=A0A419ENZ4_9BACT|nr:MAG: hypothetical protein C4532_19105 [Candidatus Abyssubacteria bacterium SURF_17]
MRWGQVLKFDLRGTRAQASVSSACLRKQRGQVYTLDIDKLIPFVRQDRRAGPFMKGEENSLTAKDRISGGFLPHYRQEDTRERHIQEREGQGEVPLLSAIHSAVGPGYEAGRWPQEEGQRDHSQFGLVQCVDLTPL